MPSRDGLWRAKLASAQRDCAPWHPPQTAEQARAPRLSEVPRSAPLSTIHLALRPLQQSTPECLDSNQWNEPALGPTTPKRLSADRPGPSAGSFQFFTGGTSHSPRETIVAAGAAPGELPRGRRSNPLSPAGRMSLLRRLRRMPRRIRARGRSAGRISAAPPGTVGCAADPEMIPQRGARPS